MSMTDSEVQFYSHIIIAMCKQGCVGDLQGCPPKAAGFSIKCPGFSKYGSRVLPGFSNFFTNNHTQRSEEKCRHNTTIIEPMEQMKSKHGEVQGNHERQRKNIKLVGQLEPCSPPFPSSRGSVSDRRCTQIGCELRYRCCGYVVGLITIVSLIISHMYPQITTSVRQNSSSLFRSPQQQKITHAQHPRRSAAA